MSEASNLDLARRWSRAGAMFGAAPAADPPDLELLLLDTVRHAGENSRFFFMAATWLSRYGSWVNAEDLAEKIRGELEPGFRPVMGLLLESASHLSRDRKFDLRQAIAECSPAAEPQPLFEIERRNPMLWKLAERHASSISRKWNLWVPNFEPKYNAIRPEEWIASKNPAFGLARR